ncbi:hypothetical protein TRAPUB_13292 [Trametes pubescens]|uniref:Pentatricopeptide repeat-containing protein n=1 Tax=Trametes pubescens TaxID=154538 RepID=A0A1M2VRG7_TRAPU|nr:hypothetical protein TRAPUB_13292 [Trametes pubescens]
MASVPTATTELPLPHTNGPDFSRTTAKTPVAHTPQASSYTCPPQAVEGPGEDVPPRYMLSRYASRDHHLRRPMYEKLAAATDLDKAWQLYQDLLQHRPAYLQQSIPHKYLHSFAAALVKKSKSKPAHKARTRTVFLRLLSVLNTIYYTGGQLRLWEWNALIDCAGRGWRKTRVDDFQAALHIYRDMVANRAPGSSFAGDTLIPEHDASRVASQPVQPDVVTYTSLISIAGRTLNPELLNLAESYLVSSGIPPNRITFLAYLRFYARKGRLGSVRSMMFRVMENSWLLSQDGTNALIYAYGRNGRHDVSGSIYRVLRHHLLSEGSVEDDPTIESAVSQLEEQERIVIPPDMKPDAVTYYTLIQVYAYHGRFRECLDVFSDMMTSPEPTTGTLEDMANYVPGTALPSPILPIFRSIFLGFARHATLPDDLANTEYAYDVHEEPTWRPWTLGQLHTLFGDFIELPHEARPSSRTVYWLLVAFAITSGYDRAILRSVWERLEGRYGGRWDGRVRELRDKIYAEELDRAFFERVHNSREQRRGWQA